MAYNPRDTFTNFCIRHCQLNFHWRLKIFFVGLWNYVFLFSNLSLFIALPFAYLFTESEGFFGHRKGLMARVYETFTVLGLLGLVVLGMTYVISALIDKDKSSIQTILSKYLKYVCDYSFISYLQILPISHMTKLMLPIV